jgi:HK97 family phage major capsid protein
MENSVELRQERAGLIQEANVMLEACKTEARDFTEDEQSSYDEKMNLIDKLKKDIETVERQESLNAEIATKTPKVEIMENKDKSSEVRGYSLFKALSGFMNNTLDGVEKELHDEAVAEARAAGRTINGLGIPSRLLEQRADVTQTDSAIAPTAVLGYQEALREASVFNQVGANILTGLSADTRLPITGKQTVGWGTEIEAAGDGGVVFGKLDLTPMRLCSYVDISKQLLLQNGMGAQNAIIADLGRAAGNKIDAAMFAAADVDAGVAPGAIAGTASVGTITSAATYAENASIMYDFVNAESTLAVNEGLAGNLAYVANPVLMKDLKQSAQVAAVSAGMQGNLVNGYPTYYTNGCDKVAGTSGDFLFGDFSKLFIGMFGGLDIMVDPYSQAINGEVRLIVNQYIDWGVSQPGAFVKATSLTA